jgi:hypothetical protein
VVTARSLAGVLRVALITENALHIAADRSAADHLSISATAADIIHAGTLPGGRRGHKPESLF